MKTFEKSKWIWANLEAAPDQYVEFYDTIENIGEKTIVNLSCDSDYTLFINGEYIASNQYGDFEHYKIFDTIDITGYMSKGKNRIDILVHYFGVPSQRYRPGKAGLIYEVLTSGQIIAFSSSNTMSRVSPYYVSGRKLLLTSQLGFSFSYDATREQTDYFPSKEIDKNVTFFKRPIKKLTILPKASIKSIKKLSDTHYLVDLGKELVGLPVLEFYSYSPQSIKIAFGEHLADGSVCEVLWDRHFFFEYKAKLGKNTFTNYMLRLGCRYLEVYTEKPIEIEYIGILPQIYDVEEKECIIENELDRRIYNASVNTLRLCMMEHYVDTPWREQCLYAFDSRNQILCGYNAFENGNIDYVKSNLRLLKEDKRDDGLISICSPCGTPLAIPSFSLYFIIELYEYVEYSGDIDFAKECLPKAQGIIEEFLKRRKNDIITTFKGEQMWNFYDWSPYLEGALYKDEKNDSDLLVNCLFIMALKSYKKICEAIKVPYEYADAENAIRNGTKNTFLTDGIFTVHAGKKEYTALGNAFAILTDIADKDIANNLCEKIVKNELEDCSLSMKVFKYEALLKVDKNKYRNYVIEEIRKDYAPMLKTGNNTVWETIEGRSAFDNAGSLCHGWSAIPVYFYHKLGIAR